MKTATYLFILILPFIIAKTVMAEGIKVNHAASELKDGVYYLNARLDYQLTEEAIEALEHGVPLFINIEIKTEKERPYFFNKTITESIIKYKLEYHPLSQRYLLTELNHGTRQDFVHLSIALDALGNIKNWPINRYENLQEKGIYQSALRASLDIQSLPAPLRPIALISSKWKLSSEWYRWKIKI